MWKCFSPNKLGIAWFSQMKTRWFHKKVKRPFVAHRFFQINLFHILYSFEFFHCVNTSDHIRWIIPSRAMQTVCQNCVHILRKVTRFGLCLFIQSLLIKFWSISDTGSSKNNKFSWYYIPSFLERLYTF